MRPQTIALALVLALTFTVTAALAVPVEVPDLLWTKVDAVFDTAGKDLPGGVHRFGWPRSDLHVRVGDVEVAPALALGSWGAFLKTGNDGKAMAMGDLVLLESELTPVVTALQAGGIDISAIHNHLVNESPHVIYVHFSGHGDAVAIATSLKKALEQTKTPLTAAPSAPAKPQPADPAYDAVQQALGRKGALAGTVLQVGVPRAEKIEENGMEIPATMGMATALNFQRVGQGTGANVATTGDFVLIASEVNPVIRELRAHGIAVTALHSHMLAETPRLFFMHFWAVGDPEKIGAGLKAALAKVNVRP